MLGCKIGAVPIFTAGAGGGARWHHRPAADPPQARPAEKGRQKINLSLISSRKSAKTFWETMDNKRLDPVFSLSSAGTLGRVKAPKRLVSTLLFNAFAVHSPNGVNSCCTGGKANVSSTNSSTSSSANTGPIPTTPKARLVAKMSFASPRIRKIPFRLVLIYFTSPKYCDTQRLYTSGLGPKPTLYGISYL